MKTCTRVLAALLGLISLVVADSDETVTILSRTMRYRNVTSDNGSGLWPTTISISRKLQDDSETEDSNDVDDIGAGELSPRSPPDDDADDDGSNDFDTLVLGFCEVQTVQLTECATEKCSQCEDKVSSSAAGKCTTESVW